MDSEKELERMDETASIQKAIEKIADAETTRLPEPAAQTSHTPADEPVHRWFFTFMCMNLPILGWFYLLALAFSKKYPYRRNFARAYLFYKLVFLLASVLIIGILVYIGLDLLDQLLAYMEML